MPRELEAGVDATSAPMSAPRGLHKSRSIRAAAQRAANARQKTLACFAQSESEPRRSLRRLGAEVQSSEAEAQVEAARQLQAAPRHVMVAAARDFFRGRGGFARGLGSRWPFLDNSRGSSAGVAAACANSLNQDLDVNQSSTTDDADGAIMSVSEIAGSQSKPQTCAGIKGAGTE